MIFDGNFGSEDFQKVIERFGRAHWITGIAVAAPQGIQMQLTPLGRARLQAIYEWIKTYGPSRPETTWLRAKLRVFCGAIRLGLVIADLKPFTQRLSEAEMDVLFALAASNARRAGQA